MCLWGGATPSEGESLALVRAGKPAATIVVARRDGHPSDREGDEQLRKAAVELAFYIRRRSGVGVPIRMDGARIDGAGLILGVFGQHASHGRIASRLEDLPDVEGLSESAAREAFALRARDGNVYFSGRTNAAISYAVLSFIEHELGVRWFAPGDLWEHLPQGEAGELVVQVEDRVAVPSTPLRIWSGHDDWDWKTRKGGPWCRWDWRNRARSRSKPIRNRLGNQLQAALPVEVYGQAHAEYYPVVRGKRFVPPPGKLTRHTTFWPCSSNPGVIDVTADFIRRWFDADPFGQRRSFSLGMDDVTNICECWECRSLDPPGAIEKDQFSDRNYTFVNAVAREVKNTHPNHYLGVLIYRQLRQPPTSVPRMEDNVYGFLTQNCGTWWAAGAEEADKQLAREWARRFGLPLGRYEYYGLGTFAPRYYPHTLDRQIKFDHQLGVDANYTELYTFLPHTAPMIWAFAKLQWDVTLDIDDLLREFHEKMFGPAAATMSDYYALLERAWNRPRPGRTRNFSTTAGQLAVSRNRHEQVLAISPDEIRAGLALLKRALGESDDPRVKKRIGIVRDALVFSQHGIETYLLNLNLRAQTIRSAADAARVLGELGQYARMIRERERFWAAARQRDDLLGETIRRLGKYLVTDEFPEMDTTVASVALDVLDWNRAHERDKTLAAERTIMKMPWPDGVRTVMRTIAAAHRAENLLKNADFQGAGDTPAADAHGDWTHKGAPDHWSLWLRDRPDPQKLSNAGVRRGLSRKGTKAVVFEGGQGGALIQSIPVTPGQTFLCTAWTRGLAGAEARKLGHTAGDGAALGSLSVSYRDAKGTLFKPHDRRLHASLVYGVRAGGWQRLALYVAVPKRAVSLVLMLGAYPLTADMAVVYDSAALQRAGAASGEGQGANLLVNPGFEAPGAAGWTIRDWAQKKGVVSLERSVDARSGKVAAKARLANGENVVVSPTLTRAVRGKRTLRLTCWCKLPAPGALYASVITYARDGKQLQYLHSRRVTTVGKWAELAFQFTTEPATHTLHLYLRPNVDGVLLDDMSLAVVASPDLSALKWNPQTVAAELRRYEPVLAEFGIKDPLRWSRARMAKEKDWVSAQARWERRVAHWRSVLLGDGPADWARWLDLDHPALRDRKARLQAGGEGARQAWAEHVRRKPDLLRISDDGALRSYLFLTHGQGLYAPDGSFLPHRAEALLEGKVHQQLFLPVLVGEKDYGWVQTANPSAHFIKYVAMAWYHQRDPKWVREFQNEVLAMVLGSDGYDIAGYSTVATRLSMVLPTYLLMKDSPAMADRFHAICSRWLWAHARQLHAVGAGGYKDNTLFSTARAQWLAMSFFSEFRGIEDWKRRLWPNYLNGWRRELLADNCHEQRTLAYHTNFVRSAVLLLGLANALGVDKEIPAEFRKLVADTVDVFVAMSTPARSTPGVNDDCTVNWDYRPMLRLAADRCDRDDWRYLATDGREGTAPVYRSKLLPNAQLAVVRSDWSPKARWLFFKVSPQGSAHHHRDTLGIQIWAGGRKLLIEPYVGDYGHERDVYNRSWWHSTPTLGAAMLPWDASPKVLHWETGDGMECAVGQMIVPVGEGTRATVIRRHVFFVERRYWVIWDEFANVPGKQVIWESFHLATRNLRIDESGRSVMTAFPDGPNLLMRIGTPGWTVRNENTRMWPVYGHDTEPTATLHYEAGGTTAERGFAALFVVVDEAGASPASFDQIQRLSDGRVRLQVSVAGQQRELTTRSLGAK